MEKNLLIRNFEPADLCSLAHLTSSLGYLTTVDQMTTRMETISKLENYWTLVAISTGIVVGYIGLNKNYFWEQDGYFLRVQALIVSDTHRRIGVGTQLIKAAEKMAGQLNAKLIVLNCGNREERRTAQLFYPSLGFEPKSTGYIKKLE